MLTAFPPLDRHHQTPSFRKGEFPFIAASLRHSKILVLGISDHFGFVLQKRMLKSPLMRSAPMVPFLTRRSGVDVHVEDCWTGTPWARAYAPRASRRSLKGLALFPQTPARKSRGEGMPREITFVACGSAARAYARNPTTLFRRSRSNVLPPTGFLGKEPRNDTTLRRHLKTKSSRRATKFAASATTKDSSGLRADAARVIIDP